jgi:hypothetical protein
MNNRCAVKFVKRISCVRRESSPQHTLARLPIAIAEVALASDPTLGPHSV